MTYTCEGTIIPTVHKIRDLGVIVDDTLSFRDQVMNIKYKSLKLISMLFKSLSSTSAALYLFAYLSFIIPTIEYGSFLFALNSKNNIKTLEKIQRIFTRRLFLRCRAVGSVIPHYRERLREFHLSTLENRFNRSDLLTLYKIINHGISVPSFQISFSTRHSHLIILRPVRLSLYKNSFFHRSLTDWNKCIKDRNLSPRDFSRLLSHLFSSTHSADTTRTL